MIEPKTNDNVPLAQTEHRPSVIEDHISGGSLLTESDDGLLELVRQRLASKEAAIEVNIDDL